MKELLSDLILFRVVLVFRFVPINAVKNRSFDLSIPYLVIFTFHDYHDYQKVAYTTVPDDLLTTLTPNWGEFLKSTS